MPTLQDINRKITVVLGTKSWAPDLNLISFDKKATKAFEALLDYIEMLQKQVKGLEEEIRKIR